MKRTLSHRLHPTHSSRTFENSLPLSACKSGWHHDVSTLPGDIMLKVALVTVSLIGCTLTRASAEEDQLKSRLPSISVTSAATREVMPDVATLRLSVSAERPTADAAAEETARSSQRVLAEIKAQGLDPRDLKTAFTVSPVFDEERGPQGQTVRRTLRGYQGRNALTVRLHDTAQAGALARMLIDKGANAFEGISFAVSDEQRPLDELWVQATKDAMRKAKLYAEAAGVRLGRVLSIDPDPDSNGNDQADLPRRAPPAGAVTTVIPVEPGVEKITAKVSITWEISP